MAGIDLIKRQRAARLSSTEEGVETGRLKGKQGKVSQQAKERARARERDREEEQERRAHVEAKTVELEEKTEVFGLTTPLLVAENGEKFGKSAGNAVWLDERRTSVSDFYQVSPRSRF